MVLSDPERGEGDRGAKEGREFPALGSLRKKKENPISAASSEEGQIQDGLLTLKISLL